MIVVLILMFIPRGYPELQVKHSSYVSRQSRSYVLPPENTYSFSDYDSGYKYGPGIQSESGKSYDRPLNIGTDSRKYVPRYEYFHVTKPYNEHLSEAPYTTPPPPLPPLVTGHYEEPTTKYDIDYERIKSEARYNARYLPAKFMSDVMYDRLKSLMHYKPYSDKKINEVELEFDGNYHSEDDDDIRTTSRNNNDIFPYFYHGPYEYEYDSNIDKVKGRRYFPEEYHNVIPVHKNISDDIPPDHKYDIPKGWPSHTVTTEASPVAGDVGFFSYVLNDYYDKASNEDPIVLNGVSQWGKPINYDSNYYDDGVNRLRRHKGKKDFRYHPTSKYIYHAPITRGEDVTENYHTTNNYSFYTTPRYISKDSSVAHGESVTERGHTIEAEFNNDTKRHELKAKDKIEYDHDKKDYKSFKDIADAIQHKFGIENYIRDKMHDLKLNQDKGENRKGFHRVYHKDEYMEDKEFFDNSNSSSRGEDKGNSSIRNGGSEVILKSQAIANVGDESNAIRRVGDRGNKHSGSSHSGHSSSNGSDTAFNKYRDLAKKTAQINNNVDYDYRNH